MSSAGFELRHVTRRYGKQAALEDVTLSLPPRVHTAIIGPSGCGKTTALRLLAGLDLPTSGEVLLDGAVVSSPNEIVIAPHERRLSMVFQDLALWPNLTLLDNVVLGLAGQHLPRADTRGRAMQALELCGIADLARRKPGTLSGGQQQRAAVARAIAPRPAFMFLDEPFLALDLVAKARLLEEIRGLAQHEGATLLLVTHDPLEALSLCQRAIVLEGGHIQAEGPLDELLCGSEVELLRAFREHLPSGRRGAVST